MKSDSNTEPSILDEPTDADLVIASLGGDHQAFGKIVTRYQRLLCSLGYSALGSVSESEDVAQEAFVEAWKKLENLREPEKLKSWLCGILRFKVSHHRRREARQPIHQADDLESKVLEADNAAIDEVTMKEEEQALMWRALEAVPETYRETLVLYYREHRSVEHVACELELSEAAVKQRLSRGRKLLQEKMMSFVEGALERSSPGKVFTAGVLSAILSVPPSAKAAAAGATAAKAGTAAKSAGLGALLAPLAGLASAFLGTRASLDQSRTEQERKTVRKTVALLVGASIGFPAVMYGLRMWAGGSAANAGTLAVIAQALVIAFVVGYPVMTCRMLKHGRALRTAERQRDPEAFGSPDDQPGSRKREFKSRASLFGIPLAHVRLAMAEEGDQPVVGWIAAGDRAFGLLFAWGGFAVAPISVGIVTCGLLSVGVVGAGFIGLGIVGLGLLAIGDSAIGYQAYASSSALGWESAASGGFAIAKEAAVGTVAYAKEINSELAASVAKLSLVDQSYATLLGIMAALIIVPVVAYARAVRKNEGK